MQQLAVEGLARLGYKQAEASRLVEQVSKDGEVSEVEDIIRAVFSLRSAELG